ncbi:EcsC family protein [Lelliottia sp. WAP21]|uniref:EcsC family protein n=1 Tax=Lelliottia sp. WAP21 TaxID=2877426 RepID=UPI001E52F11F|nr:EcsC family protein [Lelliottia sp. WAP21]
MKLVPYDQTALTQIHKWKNPESSFLSRSLEMIGKPLNSAGEVVLSTPVVGNAIQSAVQGLVGVCNDAALWSVRSESIFDEFRKDGFEHIYSYGDIETLRLEDIDKTVGWLAAKYKGLALAEGAGTGALGIAGIAIDIPSLITLNLRAIGEYATYYGFDINRQEERLFAFNILGFSSASSTMAKNVAMAQLVKISQQVAKKVVWEELEKQVFVKIIKQIASSLGIRITKAKLAQIIPVAGAAVGGGYNAWFTSNVCEAAYNLYRERFLAMKYDPSIISQNVKPAETFFAEGAEVVID